MRERFSTLLKSAKAEQKVTLFGWLRSKRVSKNVAFLVLNDGSTQKDLQLVVDGSNPDFSKLGDLGTGASIRAEGVFKVSQGKGQEFEVHAESIEIFGQSTEDYPLQKKGHTLEFLREIAHLRGRTNTFGAVYRVRNQLAFLVHEFFQNRVFVWAHTPLITASDAEGAGEMFQVTTLPLDKIPRDDKGLVDYKQDFFGKAAHLTVSGQLNGEALALSVGDIYTFGPTFRAENSNTTRHLAEFWMVEPEMAFATLKDDMNLAEDFLRYLFGEIVKRCPDELEFLGGHYKNSSIEQIAALSNESFGRITYTDAVNELLKCGQAFEFPVKWGIDLQTEHERYLSEVIFKKPVIVTDYPKDFKAFYMRMNDDGKTVAAMDVLAPRIGEIIGGSQREDRIDVLKSRMRDFKIEPEDLNWYLDLRRYGGVPHAGFGLGFERLVQYVTGMANIRDVIPFPRFPQGIHF